MNDKELADAILGLGVGKGFRQYAGAEPMPFGTSETLEGGKPPCLDHYYLRRDLIGGADNFVRDWRVAGTCLERWPTTINVEHLDCTLNEMLRDPRKIIEAFVEALS